MRSGVFRARWGSPSAGIWQRFFSIDCGKILILLWLGRRDMPARGQNLDSQRLAAKILRNKELTTRTGPGGCRVDSVTGCFGSVRTIPLWALHMLSKGCTSHRLNIFLWKAVEK